MTVRILHGATLVLVVPSLLLAAVLLRSEPDAVYRLGAVVGVVLLLLCTAPLILVGLSHAARRRDGSSDVTLAVVGFTIALFLGLFTVTPVLDLLLGAAL